MDDAATEHDAGTQRDASQSADSGTVPDSGTIVGPKVDAVVLGKRYLNPGQSVTASCLAFAVSSSVVPFRVKLVATMRLPS